MAIQRDEERKNPWEEVQSYSQYRESEYFDVSNQCIILLDIVLYENRSEMIEGLKDLFGSQLKGFFTLDAMVQNIPDIKKNGLFSQSGRIGTIHNTKRFQKNGVVIGRHGSFLMPDGGYRELPEEIDYIEVHLEQLFDFSYYLLYVCRINEAYRNQNIKETYVKSGDVVPKYSSDGATVVGAIDRGPSLEPTILIYENKIIGFLKNFCSGLFLNKKSSEANCPTVRVLSTPHIDFNNFPEWETRHSPFLYYLGMRAPAFSRHGASLLSYQEEKIFPEYSFPHGLCILYSEQEVDNSHGSSLGSAITYDAGNLASSLTDFLLPFYGIVYAIRQLDHRWSEELRGISSIIATPKSKEELKVIEQSTTQIIEFYGKFTIYANEERIHLRKIEERINIYSKRFILKPIPLGITKEFDIFIDMQMGIERWSNAEKNILEDIQKQVDTLFAYKRDMSNTQLNFSNMSLQDNIKYLALITMIVGGAIPVILALLQHFGLLKGGP